MIKFKKLDIPEDQYGAIVSSGTFTHGHVGPKAFDELLRILKPDGLFIVTIHSGVFRKGGFEQKLSELKTSITDPIFQEVKAYGNNQDKRYGDDKVIITIFRKKTL